VSLTVGASEIFAFRFELGFDGLNDRIFLASDLEIIYEDSDVDWMALDDAVEHAFIIFALLETDLEEEG
jgi:hypothetical protein